VLSPEAPLLRRPARPAARALIRAAAFAAALALGLVAAGCGSGDPGSGGDDAGASTELTISLDTDGSGGESPNELNLSCPGGDAAACQAIADLPEDPMAEIPVDQACTEVYGGPDILSVQGTLRGEQVAGSFSRTNGCEIERFDRFTDVLAALYPDYQSGTALVN
jgi:hypothetical protein